MPDAASFTSGMLTGAIQGSYYFGLATPHQLEHSKAVKVYQGPGQSTDAFIVSNHKGRSATSRCARRCPSRSTARRSSARSTRAPR